MFALDDDCEPEFKMTAPICSFAVLSIFSTTFSASLGVISFAIDATFSNATGFVLFDFASAAKRSASALAVASAAKRSDSAFVAASAANFSASACAFSSAANFSASSLAFSSVANFSASAFAFSSAADASAAACYSAAIWVADFVIAKSAGV